MLPFVDLGQTAKLKMFQRLINTHNFKLWAKMKSHPIKMQNSLIIISGSNQSISQIYLQGDKSPWTGNLWDCYFYLLEHVQACSSTLKLAKTCQRYFWIIWGVQPDYIWLRMNEWLIYMGAGKCFFPNSLHKSQSYRSKRFCRIRL